MGRLIPVILTLLGLAVGGGAGVLLQPRDGPDGAKEAPAAEGYAEAGSEKDAGTPSPPEADAGKADAKGGDDGADGKGADNEYVKMSNQFVVPIVDAGQVSSMIVLSLSLEVASGGGDAVFAREPKLRDALLQVLFDHANAGGFRDRFTDPEAMLPLRRALREAAVKVLPGTVKDVLISDILRHDS